jgi:hypothetical protein
VQLVTATTLLKSSGALESSQSRVNMNATAFKILSSGLYSDKIGAVLREIGCNAADAHIMAGIPDRPFEVKLPTALDPTFSIKDYGPGLSHEDVMNNYQTYFHSTKAHSNEVTGCFGLGSKSPYAYTDQFTVKSAHDGVLRIYFCAFNDVGVPTTSLVSESPVSDDWPHGLEVSIPISYSDQSAFETKAQETYRWFAVPPVITGGSAIRPVEYEWTVGRFRRIANKWSQNIAHPMLVMGNVAYRFDHFALRNEIKTRKLDWLDTVLNWLYMQDIAFEVPIGLVDITASRESVEYTPRAQKALVDLFVAEVTGIAEQIDSFFGARPNITTGTISDLVKDLAGEGGKLEVIRQLGSALNLYVSAPNRTKLDVALSGEVEFEGWGALCSDAYDRKVTAPYGTQWYWDGDRRRSRVFTGKLPTGNHIVVLVNDRPKRASDRIVELMRSNKTLSVLTFGSAETDGWKAFPPALEANPIPIDYQLVSQLPTPPRKVKGGAGLVIRRKGDEKEIGVWDVATPAERIPQYGFEPPPRAIKDIPDDSRYYVVREAGGWGRRYIHTHTGTTSHPVDFFKAVAELGKHGLPALSHLAVVTHGEVGKKKLADFGFQPLNTWMKDVLEKDQRVIDYRANSKLSVSVRLNTYGGGHSLTKALFLLLNNNKPTWPPIARALAGTQYLADLEALAVEHATAVARVQQIDLLGAPPYEPALVRLGYATAHRYEQHDFDTKLVEVHEAYPKLKCLTSELVFESGVFNFQLMALVMAVSPNDPIIVSTAEEN